MATNTSSAATKRKPIARGKAQPRKGPASKKTAAKKTATKSSAAKRTAAKKTADRKPATRNKTAAKPTPSTTATVQGAVEPTPPLIKTLRGEHRHIASVLRLFGEQLDAIDDGQPVDTHVVYEIMHYMVTWPDRFHHPREDLIYGRVAELDATAADNVDSLQRDHDSMARAGREVLKNIQQWRNGEVSGAVPVRSGRAYVEHLYQHMNSEESIVFPQIEQILTPADWVDLEQDDQLLPIPDPVFGKRVQREFRNMARKLRSSLRRSIERGTLVEWLSVEAFLESLDVVAMAYESARGTTGEHLRLAVDDGLGFFRESALTAPWKLAANNTRLGFRLVQEIADISRDAVGDLSKVNRERKDRIRLMDGG